MLLSIPVLLAVIPAAAPLRPAPSAPAHGGGPPVALTLGLTETDLFLAVGAEPEVLRSALGYPGSFMELADVDEHTRAFRFLEELLREEPLVSSPNASAPLRLTRVDLVEDASGAHVQFEVALPLDAPARSAAVVWRRWTDVVFDGDVFVPLLIPLGADTEAIALTPNEPEYVWHSRGKYVRPKVRALTAEATGIEVPVLSLALGAAAVGVALLRQRIGLSGTTAAGLVAGLATGAVLLREQAVAPLGHNATPSAPDEARALEIFRTLHSNIYAAFDAKTEDDIYDLLATSVAPALLDELYVDIYESLVLREEGGAVCAIEKVEPLTTAVLASRPEASSDDSAFDVDHEWRVHGLVAHWGHLHRRVNHYRATYGVAHDSGAWRIKEVRVHERRREVQDEDNDE